MLCPKCGNPLIIVKSRLELVNDNTPNAVTEAFRCLDMVCTNANVNQTEKPCSNYAGVDLSAPLSIVTIVKHNEHIDMSDLVEKTVQLEQVQEMIPTNEDIEELKRAIEQLNNRALFESSKDLDSAIRWLGELLVIKKSKIKNKEDIDMSDTMNVETVVEAVVPVEVVEETVAVVEPVEETPTEDVDETATPDAENIPVEAGETEPTEEI